MLDFERPRLSHRRGVLFPAECVRVNLGFRTVVVVVDDGDGGERFCSIRFLLTRICLLDSLCCFYCFCK